MLNSSFIIFIVQRSPKALALRPRIAPGVPLSVKRLRAIFLQNRFTIATQARGEAVTVCADRCRLSAKEPTQKKQLARATMLSTLSIQHRFVDNRSEEHTSELQSLA